jgi:hypothetical protein
MEVGRTLFLSPSTSETEHRLTPSKQVGRPGGAKLRSMVNMNRRSTGYHLEMKMANCPSLDI